MNRRKVIAAVVVCLVLAIGMIVWSGSRKSDPDFALKAKPNAYDDFTKAGKMLMGSPMPAGKDEAFVARNKPALDAFRFGLKKRFEAPLETYDLQTFSNLVLPNMGAFRNLAQAVKAEAEAAVLAGNYPQAASIYLEIIQFGEKIEAGPLVFLLSGLSVEDIGRKGLEGLQAQLSGMDRAAAAEKLKDLQTERITFEQVQKRETYFGRRNSLTPIHYIVGRRLARGAIESARLKYKKALDTQAALIEKLGSPPPSAPSSGGR